jgi:PPP family 3-phenylpropionic acid transporter
MAGSAYLLYRQATGLLGFVFLTALGINGVMYLNTAAAVLVGRMTSRGGNGGGGTFASYRVWGSIGYVVVSLIAGALLSRTLGAQGTMSRQAMAPLFLYGPLLFFLIAVVVLFVPDPKREAVAPDSSVPAQPEDADSAEAQVCSRNLGRFLRAHFLCIFAYTGSIAYLSLHLKSLGATPFAITGVFAAGVACEAVVMMVVGRLSDRFGRRPLLAIAYAFLPIRLLLYIPATGPLWVLGVQTIHGINFGIIAAVAVAFVNDLCGEHNRGATQAKLMATGGLAAALGPATGGWLAQRLGIPATFGILAGVAASGACVFLWKVRESHPHREPFYRYAPARLRPLLGALALPMVRLSRLRKVQKDDAA